MNIEDLHRGTDSARVGVALLGPGRFLDRGAVIGDTYVYEDGPAVTGYELASGHVRWTRQVPIGNLTGQFAEVSADAVALDQHLLSVHDGADLYPGPIDPNDRACCVVGDTVAVSGVTYARLRPSLTMTGYARGTNRRLWQTSLDYGSGWAVDGGFLYADDDPPHGTHDPPNVMRHVQRLALRSGEKLPSISLAQPLTGGTVLSAFQGTVLVAAAGNVASLDMSTGALRPYPTPQPRTWLDPFRGMCGTDASASSVTCYEGSGRRSVGPLRGQLVAPSGAGVDLQVTLCYPPGHPTPDCGALAGTVDSAAARLVATDPRTGAVLWQSPTLAALAPLMLTDGAGGAGSVPIMQAPVWVGVRCASPLPTRWNEVCADTRLVAINW
jgi:hypothetical protein